MPPSLGGLLSRLHVRVEVASPEVHLATRAILVVRHLAPLVELPDGSDLAAEVRPAARTSIHSGDLPAGSRSSSRTSTISAARCATSSTSSGGIENVSGSVTLRAPTGLAAEREKAAQADVGAKGLELLDTHLRHPPGFGVEPKLLAPAESIGPDG